MNKRLALGIVLSLAVSPAVYSESRFSNTKAIAGFGICMEPSLLKGDCRVTYGNHPTQFAYFRQDHAGQWHRYQLVKKTGCKTFEPVAGVVEEPLRPDNIGPMLRHVLHQYQLPNDGQIDYVAYPKIFKNSGRRVIIAINPKDRTKKPSHIPVHFECTALESVISLEPGSLKIELK